MTDSPIGEAVKDAAEFEWRRLDGLRSQSAFQAGFAIAFAGGIKYIFENPPAGALTYVVFETCRWFAVLGLAAQLFFLIRGWHGFKYGLMPQPALLRDQFDRISAAHGLHAEPDVASAKAAIEFEKRLFECRLVTTQYNRISNNKRSGWLHLARVALIWSLVPLAVGYVASRIPGFQAAMAVGYVASRFPGRNANGVQPNKETTMSERPSEEQEGAETEAEPTEPTEAELPPPMEPEYIREGDTSGGADPVPPPRRRPPPQQTPPPQTPTPRRRPPPSPPPEP